MTADTIIKFKDQGAECKAGGHQCDFIGQMVAKLMSTDLSLAEVHREVKIETAAKSALAGFKDVKLAQSDAPQTVQDIRTSSGIQV